MFFGHLTDVTGKNFEEVSGIEDVHGLMNYLQNQYPDLAGLKITIAINNQIVADNAVLQKGDTVALMPPFSGG